MPPTSSSTSNPHPNPNPDPHPHLSPFTLTTGPNPYPYPDQIELEDSTRHLALEFLLTVAEQTPTVARKLPGFCASVVPVALQMMLDVEGDTPEELKARPRPRTHSAPP